MNSPQCSTFPPENFCSLVNVFLGIINIAIPVILALIMLFFIWRVIDAWIIHGDDETKRAEGKQAILIGLVVTFIAAAIWSVVALLRTSIFGG